MNKRYFTRHTNALDFFWSLKEKGFTPKLLPVSPDDTEARGAAYFVCWRSTAGHDTVSGEPMTRFENFCNGLS